MPSGVGVEDRWSITGLPSTVVSSVPIGVAALAAGAALGVPVAAVALASCLLLLAFARRPLALAATWPVLVAIDWAGLFGLGGALEKGLLVAVALVFLPVGLSRGLIEDRIPLPVLAVLFVTALSMTLSVRPEGLGADLSGQVAVCTVYLVASLRWRQEDVKGMLLSVALAPAVSVLAGVVLKGALGSGSIFAQEYTGVDRLAGATIPAFLALLAVAAVAACVLLVLRGSTRLGVLLGLLNALIAVLTVTRGAVAAIALMLGGLLVSWLFSDLRRASRPAVALVSRLYALCAAVVLGYAAYSVAAARTELSGKQGDATSGRLEAWTYLLDATSESWLFGRGVGSVPVLTEGAGFEGDFGAAHNVYLQFLVESGFVGGLLIMLSIVYLFRERLHMVPRSMRPHLMTAYTAVAVYAFTDNLQSLVFGVPFGLVVSLYAASATPDLVADVRADSPVLGPRLVLPPPLGESAELGRGDHPALAHRRQSAPRPAERATGVRAGGESRRSAEAPWGAPSGSSERSPSPRVG